MPFAMPAEWESHERTLMGWPCRPTSWGPTLAQGRAEFAAVANAIAQFEPVTLVCTTAAEAHEALGSLSARVETIVHPMDGSWLRDNSPLFVTDSDRREARLFRFNAWGERHAFRDRDIATGRFLAERFGDGVQALQFVLEGGAVHTDGAGTLVLTEGCVMHPNRNWQFTREQVESGLKEALGARRVVWLPQGLEQDLDRAYGTDGHIDMFFDFIGPGRCFLLSVEDSDPDAAHLARSRQLLCEAGIEVVDFPYMSGFDAGGRRVIAPYLNFYVCNGAVIVPVTGAEPDKDAEALAFIARHWKGREVVGITMRAAPMQGGAIHCMTMQVPARRAPG